MHSFADHLPSFWPPLPPFFLPPLRPLPWIVEPRHTIFTDFTPVSRKPRNEISGRARSRAQTSPLNSRRAKTRGLPLASSPSPLSSSAFSPPRSPLDREADRSRSAGRGCEIAGKEKANRCDPLAMGKRDRERSRGGGGGGHDMRQDMRGREG